ncbi:bromodomain and PHD finger-containing protein 1, brpf1, putative [Ixodes scapularis]|uniref:Bromodomain and PHD finger-containing protein 1, brpf1, putative n=1 Tax=Ixodes scapularis TaxID=6945 RepID=B7QC82_IXOSC|nr:bromodomain and PHD finger-containing protein 1, brpf1, putative [Ixodes scapularis]|eukprot:XP_002413146.1 bromodomain and PHD finger-containing protein 1, brpf1, putative [Ixodes scapularis]
MLVNIDIRTFCQNLRATKPPYECPLPNCGRIYKTYSGIQFHLYNFEHDGATPQAPSTKKGKRGRWHHRQNRRSPTPPDLGKLPAAREALTYAEAQKIVEVDLDGNLHRINICEPLDLVFSEPGEEAGDAPVGTAEPAAKGASGGKQAAVPSTVKLPEASFRLVADYNPADAPQRPASYYRFIERSAEELDEAVEYDMDEEDCAWLQLMNGRRRADGLGEVSCDTFELLMDRLEKESYFQSQSSGRDLGPPIDEDAVCAICSDGECQNSNAILFCDMCNLAVHQTDDGRWAHVVCALWVPEVCFANTVFLEPIDSLGNIPAARWKLTCYICKQRGVGACIQCHRANCYTAFHVTCAQQAGLYMRLEEEATLHVRKAAYCDAHAPAGPVSTGASLPATPSHPRPVLPTPPHARGDSEGEGKVDVVKKAQAKAKSREKMRKARKILAEKRSAVPVVSIPTLPGDRLAKIATLTSLSRKQPFLERLLGYWTLKRQSRNGVPLLRRLQMAHPGRRDTKESDPECSVLREQLKFWQRLRQDLERARLLVPDYLHYISQPMDFWSMEQKLRRHEYASLDQFEADFRLVVDNCTTYNSKDTPYYRAAVKMREQGGALIRQARAQAERCGYDPDTGMHLDGSPGRNAERPPPADPAKQSQPPSEGQRGGDTRSRLEALLPRLAATAGPGRRKLAIQVARLRRQLTIESCSRSRRQRGLRAQDSGSGAATAPGTAANPAEPAPKKGSPAPPVLLPRVSPPSQTPAGTSGTTPVRTRTFSEQVEERKQREGEEEEAAPPPPMREGEPPRRRGRGRGRGRGRRPLSFQRGGATRGARSGRAAAELQASRRQLLAKKRGRSASLASSSGLGLPPPPASSFPPASPLPQTDSFKVYRSSRNEQASDSDRESSSGSSASASSSHPSSDGPEATDPDDDDDSHAPGWSQANGWEEPLIPLEPLDLVWAKCRGYPWYPALIINPQMPRGGFTQNGVPIPVPPEEVLGLRSNYQEPVYLVLFFDTKRTWQWLPRNKLEPLGVDTARDKAKLVESKKPAERKAVKKAYENAILHRCRVTGESTGLSGDSSSDD